MARWIKTANEFRGDHYKKQGATWSYLENFNEYLTDTDNNDFGPLDSTSRTGLTSRIYQITQRDSNPTLSEALNLDRLTRWFSIPFELLAKANDLFSKQSNGKKFTDMQGFISENENTFDKTLRFDKPADYREQFMNWHTAQKYIKTSDYSIGSFMYIRSAIYSLTGSCMINFDNKWKANKKAGFYYLNSKNNKNSIRNMVSVKSEIAYLDHPNDGKSWKTSGFEENGNQPVTQRAKQNNNHMDSRLAADFEYDLFPIGHPLNPFSNAFVIDFWGEYKGDTSKTEVGTYRARISYEDYISHINNIKDSDVLSDLRTITEFYGRGKSGKVLPDMDEVEFNRLIAQDSEFRDVVRNAMFPNLKGCWGDTFIEFNNLGKLLKFQIEFLGKHSPIYKKVKQNDIKYGFNPDHMPTLFVCKNDEAKLAYLKDHADIGINSPILTKAEYFAFMKAWWYAYAEMTIDGEFRDRFDFTGFITNLAAQANNWNIDPAIALRIMGAFGYNQNGARFTGTGDDVFKWICKIRGKPDKKFEYGASSSNIALVFLDYFYMSWIPYYGTSVKFDRWKPIWS